MADEPLILATVIRADGMVPFDDDVSDEARAQHLGALLLHGHDLAPVHGTRHFKIRDYKGHPRHKHAG